jgi:hypothetical protein
MFRRLHLGMTGRRRFSHKKALEQWIVGCPNYRCQIFLLNMFFLLHSMSLKEGVFGGCLNGWNGCYHGLFPWFKYRFKPWSGIREYLCHSLCAHSFSLWCETSYHRIILSSLCQRLRTLERPRVLRKILIAFPQLKMNNIVLNVAHLAL